MHLKRLDLKNDKNLTTTKFGSNSKFILHQHLYYYSVHQE